MSKLQNKRRPDDYLLKFVPLGNCSNIQAAIDGLPAVGGQVLLDAGTYTCLRPIVIDRDNVDLRGKGLATVLRLANGANSPVVVLGQTTPNPSTVRSNIKISDLCIDGKRLDQSVEGWGGPCDTGGMTHVRNNGLELRHVEDILIERVTVKSARSGGLVSTKVCRRLMIRDFTSYDNHFDALAAYETEESTFTGLHLYNNQAAGLSLDIGFNNNIISNVVIVGSRSVGVFMRDSRDNIFSNIQVRNSGGHGFFLAQVDDDFTKPATRNVFNSIVVSNARGAGFRVNDDSCTNNIVCGAQFVSNRDGGIVEVIPRLVTTFGINIIN